MPGELWIGGRGVAFGYRGDPRRTADRFVRRAGDRWYRTGDLGRYWPDGTLEFLGRSDQQVKVGGHRIELTEVEAAMEGFPLARAGAVVAVGDRHRRALHAFVVPAAPVTDDAEPAEAAASPEDSELAAALRAHLADRLPPYAVPARVSVLPELPLTANGKIDRLALATLGEDLTSLDGVAPDPGAQSAIAALWSELLGVHIADRDANFFGAGGDSMLALRMVGALRARYGVDVPVRGFLAAPTVAGLAALVLEHGDAAVFEPDAFEEGVL
ncbi:hypothetical protein KBI5_17815 [Frankia sp. KB5]|nr:hypothetical protein KBI5_17815 [Frankia sp. KB5]